MRDECDLGKVSCARSHASFGRTLTPSHCLVQRLHELRMSSPEEAKAALRLTVEAGGCSGFSYQ
jgi:hypothetical protein